MRDVTIEVERETDGRWIAEVMNCPGALAYGHSREEAVARAKTLAVVAFADLLDHAPVIEPRRRA